MKPLFVDRVSQGNDICLTNLIERHIISVLVDNEPGVLARVIGLFSGRGYNIESLTVAETDETRSVPHFHRDVGHADGDRADQGSARDDWFRSIRCAT